MFMYVVLDATNFQYVLVHAAHYLKALLVHVVTVCYIPVLSVCPS